MSVLSLHAYERKVHALSQSKYPLQTTTLPKAAWGTQQWSVNLSLALSNSYTYSTRLSKLLRSIGIFLSAAGG